MKAKPHLYKNGTRNPGPEYKLRFRRIGCNTIFPNADHCDICYPLDFKLQIHGPKQWNMHNLDITACCRCMHELHNFTEQQWKELCDVIGFDYGPYDFNAVYNSSAVETGKFLSKKSNTQTRPKLCKMCKEEDAEIGKYCEACHSFRVRNGLAL